MKALPSGVARLGVNILFKSSSDLKFARKYGISESELHERVSKAKKLLLIEKENLSESSTEEC